MSDAASRPCDPWSDAGGTHIPLFSLVEQVEESAEPTALPSRLHQRGQVLGRSCDSLYACFDGQVISLQPHPVRVLDTTPTGGG